MTFTHDYKRAECVPRMSTQWNYQHFPGRELCKIAPERGRAALSALIFQLRCLILGNTWQAGSPVLSLPFKSEPST